MSGAVENFDPGSPRYEAARALLVEDLLRIDADAYGEMAEDLKAGDLMRVPSWVAMQVIARLLPTTPPARSYADGVEDAAKRADAGLAQWNKIVAAGGVTVAGIPIAEEEAHVAAGACEALAAAIRLLSQGDKA